MFTMYRNDALVDPLKKINFLHDTRKTYAAPFTAQELLMRELKAIGLAAGTSVPIGEAEVGTQATSTGDETMKSNF